MKTTVMKKALFLIASTALAIPAFAPGISFGESQEPKLPKVKNIIFMVGDGMGMAYVTAHRYMKNNPATVVMEETEFDKHFVGMQKTYGEDDDENITDSAAAATAMAGGVKTYNTAISVDNDLSEVKTILEYAKGMGKSTGLVATSELTDATPAAFGAHDSFRKNMNALANDFYDEKINGSHKIDVMLGGGSKYFVRNDRNLVNEFRKDGYSIVSTRNNLLANNNNKVLGLFAEEGLDKMIDRTEQTPSLEEMATTAIKRLNTNKNGFFLMVEGSQIDWAGHDNDIVAAMSEMEDFERALKAVIEFAKKDGNTLVVLTADHSTGGLSVGANKSYFYDVTPIKAAKRTPEYLSKVISEGANVRDTLKKFIDLPLTEQEVEAVVAASKVTDQGLLQASPHIIATQQRVNIANAIEAIFNNRTFTGWTSVHHTGEDVPVYAYGPGKELFAGLHENTEISKNFLRLFSGKVVNQ